MTRYDLSDYYTYLAAKLKDPFLPYKHISLQTALTTLTTDFTTLKSDVDAFLTKVKTEVAADAKTAVDKL